MTLRTLVRRRLLWLVGGLSVTAVLGWQLAAPQEITRVSPNGRYYVVAVNSPLIQQTNYRGHRVRLQISLLDNVTGHCVRQFCTEGTDEDAFSVHDVVWSRDSRRVAIVWSFSFFEGCALCWAVDDHGVAVEREFRCDGWSGDPSSAGWLASGDVAVFLSTGAVPPPRPSGPGGLPCREGP